MITKQYHLPSSYRDILLFKLAFHTYEALSNKAKLKDRKNQKEVDQKDTSSVGGASKTQAAQDTATELDLASNCSDESTITMGGPAGPQRERKIERYDESLDVKLNQYLMKW